MKNKIALSALACLQVAAMTLPALADDVWFAKYGHHGAWNYDSFCRAERDYEIRHHEARLSKHDLRVRFDQLDADHDGMLHADDVRTFHQW
jgi:hypothetical protein